MGPSETRIEQFARSSLYSISFNRLTSLNFPDEHAVPDEILNPSRSIAITWLSPFQPGVIIQDVLGSLFSFSPTQSFAKALSANGMIDEVREKQIFSLDDDRFLPDRYIVGICPTCGYDKALGDQCESCTKQLDPTELLQPKSAISGSSNLETRETKHLYLKQSLMKEKLEEWISEKNDWIVFPWENNSNIQSDRNDYTKKRGVF